MWPAARPWYGCTRLPYKICPPPAHHSTCNAARSTLSCQMFALLPLLLLSGPIIPYTRTLLSNSVPHELQARVFSGKVRAHADKLNTAVTNINISSAVIIIQLLLLYMSVVQVCQGWSAWRAYWAPCSACATPFPSVMATQD